MSGSYIGRNPQYGFFEKQRITTANGVLTAFNLAFDTTGSAQLLVSVAGVIQEPGQAYTVLSGTPQQISFTEAPANGVDIFIIWMGKELTGPRFGSDMITDQVALGSAPAATDQFIVYDADASTLKKVAYSNVHSGVADMTGNSVKVRDNAADGAPSDKVLTTTQILIGDGTGFTAAALSSDVTMTNTGAVTIANAAVSNAKLANMAANTIKVRDADSSGVPTDLAVTTTQIVIGDGTGFTAAALSGDVTMTNAGAVTVANNAVSLAKLSDGTQGGTIYYGAAGAPTELAAGASGLFLKTQGAGANPTWASVPAGAPTGGGTDKVFFENEQSVDTDYTLTAANNAVSAGPCTVASGVTVTIPTGAAWVIV